MMRIRQTFDAYGLANSFEIYHGTHTRDVAFRIQDHVMPFFSQNLVFSGSR